MFCAFICCCFAFDPLQPSSTGLTILLQVVMLAFYGVDFIFSNPLNPIVHFWLHHTAHCAEKIVSACLRAGSASAERVGQGEVGGVTGRVLCTW